MSETMIPSTISKTEILQLLADGAYIQPDRHGAAVIRTEGRCGDDWEELRRDGWLSKTTAGTYTLSDRGREAINRTRGGDGRADRTT